MQGRCFGHLVVAMTASRLVGCANACRVLFPTTTTRSSNGHFASGARTRWVWSFRTLHGRVRDFGKRTYREVGRPWWDYHQIPRTGLGSRRLLITFAFVATHNHFACRPRRQGIRSAPVIKLPAGSGEDDHLGVLAVLNSSVGVLLAEAGVPQKGRIRRPTRGAATTGHAAFDRFLRIHGDQAPRFPLPTPPRWSLRAVRWTRSRARRMDLRPPLLWRSEAPHTRGTRLGSVQGDDRELRTA